MQTLWTRYDLILAVDDNALLGITLSLKSEPAVGRNLFPAQALPSPSGGASLRTESKWA